MEHHVRPVESHARSPKEHGGCGHPVRKLSARANSSGPNHPGPAAKPSWPNRSNRAGRTEGVRADHGARYSTTPGRWHPSPGSCDAGPSGQSCTSTTRSGKRTAQSSSPSTATCPSAGTAQHESGHRQRWTRTSHSGSQTRPGPNRRPSESTTSASPRRKGSTNSRFGARAEHRNTEHDAIEPRRAQPEPTNQEQESRKRARTTAKPARNHVTESQRHHSDGQVTRSRPVRQKNRPNNNDLPPHRKSTRHNSTGKTAKGPQQPVVYSGELTNRLAPWSPPG